MVFWHPCHALPRWALSAHFGWGHGKCTQFLGPPTLGGHRATELACQLPKDGKTCQNPSCDEGVPKWLPKTVGTPKLKPRSPQARFGPFVRSNLPAETPKSAGAYWKGLAGQSAFKHKHARDHTRLASQLEIAWGHLVAR